MKEWEVILYLTLEVLGILCISASYTISIYTDAYFGPLIVLILGLVFYSLGRLNLLFSHNATKTEIKKKTKGRKR